VTKARERLGFSATTLFEEGLAELVDSLDGEVAIDRVDEALGELAARGLVR
jgi:dTDP-L-rhamnose 4-epimerase